MCVVFIVSLKCPALEAHLHLHLAIVGLKVASPFLARGRVPTSLKAEFQDIRVAVSFVRVSVFKVSDGLSWGLHVFVYSPVVCV